MKMRSNLYIHAKTQIDEILEIPDPTITPTLKEFIKSLHFSDKFYENINTYEMVTSLKSLLWLPHPYLPPHPTEIHTFEEKKLFKF